MEMLYGYVKKNSKFGKCEKAKEKFRENALKSAFKECAFIK